MHLLIDWICRQYRHVLLPVGLCALASLIAVLGVGLRESYTVASFVGSRNPEFERLQRFLQTFSSSELSLIAVRGDHALDPRTLSCLEHIVPRVEALPAVRKAAAISQIRFGRALMLEHPLVRDVLVSRDQRTAAVIIQMQPEARSGDVRRQTVAQLRRIVSDARAQYPDLELILTGPYVTMLEMFDFVRQDLQVFSVGVGLLMLILLYVVIGSARVAVYAMGVAASAVLCTLGLTILIGVNVSLTTQMIVTLVAVLAVATCVHLAVGCRDAGARFNPRAAGTANPARAALHDLLVPCTAVILTSATGFASVTVSDIQPVRSFGFLMVIGLLLALVGALCGVAAVGRVAVADQRRGFHEWLSRRLSNLADVALRRRGAVLVGFAVLTVFLILPIPGLRFESDFVKNFRPGSAVRRGYEFVERHLAPLGLLEMVVRHQQGASVVHLPTVRACAELADEAVQRYPAITKAVSLADCLRVTEQDLPETELGLQTRFAAARQILGTLFGSDILANFVTDDGAAMRVTFMAREGISVWDKLAMAEQLKATAETRLGSEYQVTMTGLYYFYATLIAGLLRDQNVSFALTLAAILVISAVALRNWKLALIAMIPNLFPIAACAGLMGWLDIPVNMATAMMLAISLGIAVDDTIHYLWRFGRELSYDGEYSGAILRTHRSVGQACVFTTLVITGGFWVLCFSRFLPTAYFGALIGVTMVGALAADLILLPVLLVLFHPVPRACALRSVTR